MRLLISGGPGSGCTSTARAVADRIGLPVFDSDTYFHKPTDPPFEQQYTPEERRFMLGADLRVQPHWILSGSIATWGIDPLEPTHGVFLNVPRAVRLQRLQIRQRDQFGPRIDAGGDMEEEHHAFILWAADYDERTGPGRNFETDRSFLKTRCKCLREITEDESLDEIVSSIIHFLGIRERGWQEEDG